MNDKEYTYDIGKYTIGVDTNGEDEIGMTVAKVENGEIYFLGNCYGENARCIDLLIKENQELKKQLEEYQKDIKDLDNQNKRAFENMQLNQLKVCNMIKQQKEFIKYLEDKIYSIEPKGTSINYNCEYDSEEDYVMAMQEQSKLNTLKEILQKYKEIIGGNKDEK